MWNYRANEEKTRYERSAQLVWVRAGSGFLCSTAKQYKERLAMDTLAFGEQPSRPHQQFHSVFHCFVSFRWPIFLFIVTNTITHMHLFIGN